MAAFPELEPSLVEIAIGEVEEPTSPPDPHPNTLERSTPSPERGAESPKGSSKQSGSGVPTRQDSGKEKKDKGRTRSVTDRYSYRAAIYKQDGS